jgi:hypothetical protein
VTGPRGSTSSVSRRLGPNTSARERNDGPGSVRSRASFFVSLAHTLCDAGRSYEAEELCRWLLEQAPELAAAHAALGRALLESGDRPAARALLEALCAEQPGLFVAFRWLAEALVADSDWPRAAEALLHAETLSPGDPRIAALVQQMTGVAAASDQDELDAATDPWQREPPGSQAGRPRTYEELGAVKDVGDTPTRSLRFGGAALGERVRAWATGRRGSGRRVRAWVQRHAGLALAMAGVLTFGAVLALALVGSWVMRPSAGGPSSTPGPGPAPRSRAPAPTAPPAPATPPAPDAFAVRAGTPEELARLAASGRHVLAGGPVEAGTTPLLALALLASEYGQPPDRAAAAWADRLAIEPLPGPRQHELAAARVLLAVARGDLASAEERARAARPAAADSPLFRFAEARLRQRRGENAAVARLLGPEAARAPFLLARLLRAEAHLDAGEEGAAAQIARGVLAASPDHPRALALLMEARNSAGGTLAAGESAAARACEGASGKQRALAATCALDAALGARRRGDRAAARARGLDAAAASAGDPRLLALTAQLLANLGLPDRAAALAAAGGRLAGAAVPSVAWAAAAVQLGRGAPVTPPAGPPPGPEARLIAARAAFAASLAGGRTDDEDPAARALAPEGRPAQRDEDLHWLAEGLRANTPGAGLRFAKRLRASTDGQAPSPVAAWVAGALARRGGRRHLAKLWLDQALDGHGDVCAAAALQAAVLVDLGRDPRGDIRLREARRRYGCAPAAR